MIPAILVFTILAGVWEILVATETLPESLFPSLRHILIALQDTPQEWGQALRDTTTHAILGLLISFGVGSVFSFLLSLSPFLKRAFLPLSLFFQTVPIIAIAPLLVIYFGFGAPTVIASSAIVSFFPVMASFLLGLETVEKEKLELFQLYQASKLDTLFKLRLPNAFLNLYSGLKVAVGLAIIGAVAGEFVAGTGLGAIIDTSRTAQRVDRVFAALLLLAAIGIMLLAVLRLIFAGIRIYRPFGPESQEWS